LQHDRPVTEIGGSWLQETRPGAFNSLFGQDVLERHAEAAK
jgi:hypothetical protein